MRFVLHNLALFFGIAVAMTAVGQRTHGQDKKAFTGQVIEGTAKAGKWGYWQARPGLQIITDRDYLLSALPKEMMNGTFLIRESGEYGRWLPDGALRAKTPVTAYAIVRTRYIGKDTFDEGRQKLMIKDGWAEVEGKVTTTSPGKEAWEWKAFKKDIDEGDVSLPLKEISWQKHGTAVMFLFTARKAPVVVKDPPAKDPPVKDPATKDPPPKTVAKDPPAKDPPAKDPPKPADEPFRKGTAWAGKRLTAGGGEHDLEVRITARDGATIKGEFDLKGNKSFMYTFEGTATGPEIQFKTEKMGLFQQTYTGKLDGGKVVLKWSGTNVKGENVGGTATLSPK